MLDILEDLSHFENIRENFVKFEDLNCLLWSCLSFSKVKGAEMLLLDAEEEGSGSGSFNAAAPLALKLNTFAKSLVTSLVGVEGIFGFDDAGKIKLLLNNRDNDNDDINNSNKEEPTGNRKKLNNDFDLINDFNFDNSGENNIEKILAITFKSLNSKLIKFITESFNLDTFNKEFEENNNKIKGFLSDKTSIVVLYFQTIQLLVQFAKNNFYFNLNAENLLSNNAEISSMLLQANQETKSNKNISNKNTNINKNKKKEEINLRINRILAENYRELAETVLLSLSENSIKSDVSVLDNFVLSDAASQNDKSFCDEVLQNVDLFFAKKPNCSIYQNLIDDYFNAINISIVFEIPELEENQYISGIDANKFAVVFLNENYFSGLIKDNKSSDGHNINTNFNKNSAMLKFYENRISLLSELFEWKVIMVNKSLWNNAGLNRLEYLKDKFGFDMQDAENLKIKVLDRNQTTDENQTTNNNATTEDEISNAEKKPKYNLTRQIINKRQNKKD